MNLLLRLTAGTAVSLLLVLSACSPPPAAKCSSANCTGCCAGDKCETGNKNTACGAAGGTCDTCSATQMCTANKCVTGSTGGGAGGGTGGAAGGGTGGATGGGTGGSTGGGTGGSGGGAASCAATCAGCCDSSGVCQTTASNTACGLNGATCAACTGAAMCNGGMCKVPGCSTCTVNGTCQTALTNTACGNGGIACVDCSASGGATCNTGLGVCTGGTCAGCRDATGACVTGNTKGACGVGGGTCAVCPGTNVCTNGSCVSGAGGGAGGGTGGGAAGGGAGGGSGGGAAGGGSGGGAAGGGAGGGAAGGGAGGGVGGGAGGGAGVLCGPGSATNPCTGGCCQSNGQCQVFAQQGNGSCGTAGNACAPCLGGQSCTTGVCQSAAVTVGSACTTSAQCQAGLGANAKCKLTTTRGDSTYTGGYCTLNCTGTGQGTCPAGNACSTGFGLDIFGEFESLCLSGCPTSSSQSTCRAGYTCYGTTGSPGNCWLTPLPTVDAGSPPDKLAYACTTSAQCISPPNPAFGFCYPPTDQQGAATFVPGGYCMSDCNAQFGGVNGCGPNGVCLDIGDQANPFVTCLGTCANPRQGKTTRPGGGTGSTNYSCFGLTFTDGGPTPFGYVFPSCDAPPTTANGCVTAGTTCNTTTGYCCFSDGGCQN